MKPIIKIILGLVGAVILLLVVAVIALPKLYDTEDLKKMMITGVKEQTGRDLRIDGELKFSVFPYLAVEVNKLSLSNPEGFGDQPFAAIGQARVGVALMPLIRSELIAEEIILSGLNLSLMVRADGRSNWGDLSDGGADQAPESSSSEFKSQRIAGLRIEDAQVELLDEQAGTHYRLSGFTLKTGALGEGGPVPVELAMQLEDLGADTRLGIDLSAIADFDFKQEVYTFDDLELSIDNNGQTISVSSPQARANMPSQIFTMESFVAELAGSQAQGSIHASKIVDDPVFSGKLNLAEFSPKAMLETLGMDVPSTTDPDVLKTGRLSTDFEGGSSKITLNNFELGLDQSKFTGEMSVANFDRPAIRFSFDIDSIDLDRYMEPVSGDSSTETDVAVPNDELQNLDLQGTLRSASLRLAGLEFSNAEVGIKVINNKLSVHPLKAGFYGGKYDGNIAVDASGTKPVISLDEKLDSITFQQLVADLVDDDRISGLAFGHLKVSGRGDKSSEVLSSLQGELGLRLDDGALEGINIWYEIRKAMAKYKGLPAPEPEPNRTVFSRMQLNADVSNGLLTTRELVGELPFLTLSGDGTIDLAESNIELGLVAAVRNMPELSNDPLVSELQGKKIPFKISGALDDPDISLDVEELLKGEAGDLIMKKLGLSGSGTPDDGKEPSGTDSNKDAAEGLLQGLFGDDKKDKKKKNRKNKKNKEKDDDGGNWH